jgi:5-methylcytosine-specific restriction protein B
VLIVDEINRGNISRIFGELITLIETSKREGAEEALEVTLPYSKRRFSVPPNVYLIGTMNTADRSLTGLDIALRRRFRFQEVPPDPDLLKGIVVEGVDIRALLMVLNERIEVMLDRDHCLGHSYFLPLRADNTLTRLELIFDQEIIPLLREYFFEDSERIRWVLNDHRKEAAYQFLLKPKSDLTKLFGDEPGMPTETRRLQLNASAFQQIQSFRGIIDAS